MYRNCKNYFNSRPHEEVDQPHSVDAIIHLYFNSRPHEEVDGYVFIECPICHISTHDLTRRSTLRCLSDAIENLHFNSRPHEEVDCMNNNAFQQYRVFQLTTSRGGRRTSINSITINSNISTHDLTRRSTNTEKEQIEQDIISTHDLTRRSTIR